ncbi:unnamed protein product [Lota lota]
MDQPPGSLDDLQPQDLSTCSIPSVVDLTRKGEATSHEAMHIVKSPRWYPNSGNGRTGLALAEAASSDIGVQSGNQIQSDNAFSNTTVTLSYVSRSHVFSSQDSLSAHSSLYSVPSITKFSLQSCESENGLGEAGYALGQHYLQHPDGPLDLATRTQLFQALAQAQVRDENNESQLCLTQPGSHGLNGGLLFGEGEKDARVQGAFESGLLMETESSLSLENGGQCHDWPASGPSSTNTGEHQGSGHLSSNELLLVSGTQEPSVVGEGAAGGELPLLGWGNSSSQEDHGSASATSPDQVSVPCPQTSRPPSAANSCPEEADVVIWDGLDTENPIEPIPSEQAQCSGDYLPRLDASMETTSPAHKSKVPSQPTDELTGHGELLKEVSARNPQKNESAVLPHINGNTETLPGSSPPRRKLPVRLGRGTRLEALVLNICPSAYKVAVHNGKTTSKATKKTAVPSHSPSPPGKEDYSTGGQKKATLSAETEKQKAASTSKMGKTERIITDNCKDSTSDCEIVNHSKNLHNGTPSEMSTSRLSAQGKYKQLSSVPPQKSSPNITAHLEPGEISFPYTLPEAEVTVESPAKSPKKSPSGNKSTASDSSIAPRKAARPPKRRRKISPGGHASSMFSPVEPEIKLKYVTYKEERRDPHLDSFSPFVRAHPQSSSPCLYTVINYAEEDSTWLDGHPQGSSASFLSGTTPGTSCLQPGRISVHGQHQRSLVCCLCGASANATGLGDLHGPYYPEGYRPTGKTKASVSGPKTNAEEEGGDEEDSSDSDSSTSSCSMRGTCGRQRARPPPGSWPQRGVVHLQQTGASGSPAAKQARMEAGGGLEEEDWYSPPVVPHEPCEYWLHEDCCIWAAGVFLVKGKVYGLEEAVKVAQATMCSGCRNPGATLGCLLKGCPSKYHYRCAVESDCVLVEENFSMKCKKHKSKSLKAPSGNRRDGR